MSADIIRKIMSVIDQLGEQKIAGNKNSELHLKKLYRRELIEVFAGECTVNGCWGTFAVLIWD